MPKIRDLGINVIPETMRPPEIGPGGGGGGCQGGSHGYPGTPQCPTGTFPTTMPNMMTWWMPTFCPGGTFPTPWLWALTPNCPAGTFTVTGRWGGAADCPAGTFVQQSETCYEPKGLTREDIAQLKQQLQQQLVALEEYAKSAGPKTVEEIDKREKELQAELAELQTRRKELEGSK